MKRLLVLQEISIHKNYLIFVVLMLSSLVSATITYDAGTNKITVVGDATCGNLSDDACDLNDIHTAEIDTAHAAGWAEWYRLRSSTYYSANGAVSYNQPKPLEFGSINLYLYVTALTGDNFTLNVAGTDGSGNAKTVVLTGINATGEYIIGDGAIGSQVVQAFKTITGMTISDAVGFATPGCSGANQACCDAGTCVDAEEECCEYEGDGCLTQDTCEMCSGTWVASKDCVNVQADCESCSGVWSTDDYGVTFEIYQKRWGRIGKYSTNSYVIGSSIYVGDGITESWFAETKKLIEGGHFYSDNGHIQFGSLIDESNKITEKGCHFRNTNFRTSDETYLYGCSSVHDHIGYIAGIDDLRMWDCNFIGYICEQSIMDLDNLIIVQYHGALFGTIKAGSVLNTIDISGSWFGMMNTVYTTEDLVISNVYAREIGLYIALFSSTSYDMYFIDCDFDDYNIKWQYSPNRFLYRQYTFNLKVTDKDGNNIQNVNVTVKDKDNTVIFSELSYANGTIDEEIVTYGYYNQTSGNNMHSYSPHTITLYHNDYQPREINLNMSEKINWKLEMSLITTTTTIYHKPVHEWINKKPIEGEFNINSIIVISGAILLFILAWMVIK